MQGEAGSAPLPSPLLLEYCLVPKSLSCYAYGLAIPLYVYYNNYVHTIAIEFKGYSLAIKMFYTLCPMRHSITYTVALQTFTPTRKVLTACLFSCQSETL